MEAVTLQMTGLGGQLLLIRHKNLSLSYTVSVLVQIILNWRYN